MRAARKSTSGMARLIYSFIASLDGYIEDAGGHFDWAAIWQGAGLRAGRARYRVTRTVTMRVAVLSPISSSTFTL
jgi:hypothetical protein